MPPLSASSRTRTSSRCRAWIQGAFLRRPDLVASLMDVSAMFVAGAYSSLRGSKVFQDQHESRVSRNRSPVSVFFSGSCKECPYHKFLEWIISAMLFPFRISSLFLPAVTIARASWRSASSIPDCRRNRRPATTLLGVFSSLIPVVRRIDYTLFRYLSLKRT